MNKYDEKQIEEERQQLIAKWKDLPRRRKRKSTFKSSNLSDEEHEVMDRVFILQSTFEEYILSHPKIIRSAELFKQAYIINNELADLYGNIHQ